MGNSLVIFPIYCPPECPDTVCFDLRDQRLRGRYAFGAVEGVFDLPLRLGVQTLEMHDAVALAQSGEEQVVEVPVAVEERRRISSEQDITMPFVKEALVSGGGVEVATQKHEGRWSHVGTLDTDMGTLLVYGRISKDIRMVLRAEILQPSGWFNRGGTFLVARAEGSYQVALKVRFETSRDRALASLSWAVSFSAVALAYLLYYYRGRAPRMPRPGWCFRFS